MWAGACCTLVFTLVAAQTNTSAKGTPDFPTHRFRTTRASHLPNIILSFIPPKLLVSLLGDVAMRCIARLQIAERIGWPGGGDSPAHGRPATLKRRCATQAANRDAAEVCDDDDALVTSAARMWHRLHALSVSEPEVFWRALLLRELSLPVTQPPEW
jgi:hypothetical protein